MEKIKKIRLVAIKIKGVVKNSVVDPEWFIPDPDLALNFPSSGSKQKFRIHSDPDPTYIN